MNHFCRLCAIGNANGLATPEARLSVSYKDHITNEIVCKKIQAAIGPYEDILTTVKKRKLRWSGHVIRSSRLCKKVEQGTVQGKRTRRKAKEKMGRQHQRVDRSRLQQQSESRRGPSEMAEDCHGCQQWCPYDPDGSGTQVTGRLSVEDSSRHERRSNTL